MAGALETLVDTLRDAFEFASKNAAALSVELLKIAALGLLLQIVFVLILVGIDALGGGFSSGLETGTSGLGTPEQSLLVLVAIVFFILFSIGTAALAATAYSVVDELTRGKRISIVAKARSLIIPISQYSTAVIAMALAVLVIPALLDFGGTGSAFSALAFLALLVVAAVVVFSIQFSFPEIAIGKRSGFDSFMRSKDLVWKNVWTVLTFDIVLLLVLMFIAIAVSGVSDLLSAITASVLTDPIMLVGAVLALSMIVSLLQTFFLTLFSAPLIYFFWKRMGEAEPAKPAATAAAATANPERGRKKRSNR